jgi:uncharacterized LabA/DUF88 family protein
MVSQLTSGRAHRIAIYWDFENIHNGVQSRGLQPHPRAYAYRESDQMVNVKAIMDYLNSLGDVFINRAYANWTLFKNYRFILLEHSVDLIQLFPRGQHAKNGADIRMAIDAMEDIVHFGEIDMQVIIGGDSDFSGVAQKLRTHGKYVIGIGARNSSNIYWIKSCNEFKYYHTLTPRHEGEDDDIAESKKKPDEEGVSNIDDAKDLLLRAVRRLSRSYDDGRVQLFSIRPMMIRMDPSFDENNYGFDNFTEFVESCKDVVDAQSAPEGVFVTPAVAPPAEAPINTDPLSHGDLESIYRNTLRQINYRLLPASDRVKALGALFNVLQEKSPVEDQTVLKELLIDMYSEQGNSITDEEAQHIWDMGYKANIYYFQEYPYRNIVLNERVQSLTSMTRRADMSIIKRLVGKCPVQPLNAEVIAEMLYGSNNDKASYIAELIGEANAAV